MTPDELQDLTQHLVDVHDHVTRYQKWRPRKAAKVLCQELRALNERKDFWNELETTVGRLSPHRLQADELLGNLRELLRAEGNVLARLGIDRADIGDVLAFVFDGIDLTRARQTDVSPQSVRNLQDRLRRATDLICEKSRGPLLHTVDFVASRKGAKAIAALGLGTANVWFAVTADGGAVSSASIKIAIAIADGNLGDIADLLGEAAG